ncbi:hypothetical protein [Streptosporangium canum]|uniref:hypothetical protein n=1 Tax=Streptosporangium canum TaxID=324952 RepID=UPI00379912BE
MQLAKISPSTVRQRRADLLVDGVVDVVAEMGLPGLHFHHLGRTGNMLAAESGAGLKDLMPRMGHDNVRAALIYRP